MSTATAAAPVRKTRTKAAEHVGTAQETEEGEPAAAQAAPKFTPALDAFEKIEKAKTEWKKSFLERGTELDLVLVGLIARQNVLFVGPPGCLAGDTVINVNRAGNGKKMRLDRLVAMSNGQPYQLPEEHPGVSKAGSKYQVRVYVGEGESRYVGRYSTVEEADAAYAEASAKFGKPGATWDASIPTYVARADGDHVRLCLLKAAWESGVKETFELRTNTGRTIRATADHPFMMEDGTFSRLGDIRIGNKVRVNGGLSSSGRATKSQYRNRYTKFHPNQRKSKGGFRVMEHHLAVEAAANGLTLDDFLCILRNDQDAAAALNYLPRGTVVHHRDEDINNNDPANLEIMADQSAHAMLHDGTDHVLQKVGMEEVFSIEKFGEEPTYDIEVEDDPHNFMANGFAVHNTAKSAMCDAIHELTGGEHFTCLLNKFTAPEELFGPPNLKMLEQGEYVRNVDGFLPTAKTAFLDEIFKAGPGILNTMLKILNEGTFKNGKQVRSCPLEFALAASNEWPGGDNAGELSALFDRFTIRKTVSTVKQAANRAKLLFGDLAHDPFDALTPAELEAARVDAASLQFNKDAADTMKTIIRELSQQGINPGDRRLRKSVSVAKAWAWLEGAKEVEPVHLEVLQYVLWEDPAEHTRKASEIVMKNCNPGGAVVAEKILLADQLVAKANLNDLGDLVTKQKELQSIIRDLGKIPGDAAKEAIRRIEAEKAKLMKAALEATS